MARATTQSSGERGARKRFWLVVLVLIGTLLLFFAPSVFSPDKVLFANDGPLGAAMAKAIQPPESMFGMWTDLNWIGFPGGTYVPNVTFFVFWALRPLLFAKIYAPICLLLLGLAAWTFFRQLRWQPEVCLIAALAAMLNMNTFSNVCWGLGSRALCLAAIFAALACFEASKRRRWPWIYLILGGLSVGMSVMEGADNGAIYSLYVAAYVVWSTWQEGSRTITAFGKGILRIAVIALFAAFIAAQSIGYLIPSAVTPAVRKQQNEEQRRGAWDFATQWSLPPKEIIRVIVPGMFGYRMDTGEGGAYWGDVGEQPGWQEHHQGFRRQSGSGEYAGIAVVLIAIWALVQSLRGAGPPATPWLGSSLSDAERKAVWFWGVAAFLSVLFAFGRYAPFYRFMYSLPYFSSIRNPIKFMHPFHLSMLILFGYGLQDLFRRLAGAGATARNAMVDQIKFWWSKAPQVERRWIYALIGVVGLTILGFLIFNAEGRTLQSYLGENGFNTADAKEIVGFAKGEIGLFLLFFLVSMGLLIALQSGAFSRNRMRWGAVLIGVLLVIDLARANAPWVRYHDYKQKYATNPIINKLAARPYEQRVATQVSPMGGSYLANNQMFGGLMGEWLQHLFQYYNIQSVDIIQFPRMPDFDRAILEKLRAHKDSDLFLAGRLWQLTNTRYVLGMKGYSDLLNQQLDPSGHGFRVDTTFDVVPKEGVTQPKLIEELTIKVAPDGPLALFEFTRALPRAALFSNWQSVTNDEAALNELANPAFDPLRTVLVSGDIAPPPAASSSNGLVKADYLSYSTKDIKLRANAETASVLLLNDRHDPEWHVFVDDKPAKLLRCNYIMRGVAVPPGQHNIEFRYEPALHGLYLTLASFALGLLLCGVLVFLPKEPARPREKPLT